MEQQGDGLEVWSDAAGENADAVAWDEAEAADAGDETEDAVAWDEAEDAVAWDEAEGAVAWDQGESDALDPDEPAALDPDGPGRRPATGEPRVDAALARLESCRADGELIATIMLLGIRLTRPGRIAL